MKTSMWKPNIAYFTDAEVKEYFLRKKIEEAKKASVILTKPKTNQ